jgi:dephospho-CoA kinase
LFIIALTGGIASGKTTVGQMLARKGAYVICSDQLAREVVRKGEPAWSDIVGHFGEGVLDPDGEIDRKRLADIVFADADERVFLEKATHPRIFQRMADILREIDADTGGEAIAVLDIPLLVEARAGGMFDCNLVVDAPPQLQVGRLKDDRGSSEEEAWSRINAQVSREDRLACADFVIRNEGTLQNLQDEVDKAWEAVVALARKAGQEGG